jgi:apolipoprotein D and lipocalin family protein
MDMKTNNPIRFKPLLIILAAFLGACTGVPEGVNVVSGFDLNRYLGTWYEIARLDHRFERGLTNITANYSLADDGGVRVINRGFNVKDREWEEAEGKAYFVGDKEVGRLKVSFFGPFYGGYNIVELDKDGYEYSMVAGPDRSYLWILSRTPAMNPEVLQELVAKAGDLGFATDELIFVEHDQEAGAGE